MNIFVIVPNWNGEDFIAECLDSLRLQTIKPDIVVVDNGSVDDSIQIIEDGFPEATLLKQPKNLGFAGGVNVGIKHAINHGADYVALFNNDATAKADWLERLVKRVKSDDGAGVVASKILRSDKQHIDSTGDFYSAWGTAYPRGRNEKDIGQYDKKLTTIFAASGGASLYRVEMLKEIGLFDEDFFAYYEDVDICFRAQLAGWNVIYEPSAVVYHKVGATSSKVHGFATYHSLKNIFFLSYKNLPLSLLLLQLPKRATYYTMLHLFTWRRGGVIASLKAALSILKLLPRKTIERWRIQKKRKVSVAAIASLIDPNLPPSTKAKLKRT